MRWEIERKQGKSYVAITNIHVMVLVDRDPELARIISIADVSFCDSVSIVKLGKWEGKTIPRCHGPDYMLKACEYGQQYGWRHFLLGGAEGIAERLADRLKEKFPGVQIAGTLCPPFRAMTEDEIDGMIQTINRSQPDIVWVALGAGKQDKWIHTYKDRIEATWFSGVGAAFDFISGNTRRAPLFWQKLGLEWLYRFVFEPRRLFVRNLGAAVLLFKFYLRSITGRSVKPHNR
jgi:N-acetylglucosaminyldiphosphoundecaprenol N-acetyl-beta-D-mannosaminyltransferase